VNGSCPFLRLHEAITGACNCSAVSATAPPWRGDVSTKNRGHDPEILWRQSIARSFWRSVLGQEHGALWLSFMCLEARPAPVRLSGLAPLVNDYDDHCNAGYCTTQQRRIEQPSPPDVLSVVDVHDGCERRSLKKLRHILRATYCGIE
jgi:hypothetical protein